MSDEDIREFLPQHQRLTLMGMDYAPEQPETGAVGWAVKLDGVLSIRTASTPPRGVKINGLVLLFGISPHGTGHWDDKLISDFWDECVRKCPDHKFEVVQVTCVETSS